MCAASTPGGVAAPPSGYVMTSDQRAVVVIGEASGDAAQTIEIVGARLLRAMPWAEVPATLDDVAAPWPVLLLEAEGVDPELLAEVLPRIDAAAGVLDLHVVVALSEAEIDVVTRHLLGTRVELLCNPTLALRVAVVASSFSAGDSSFVARDGCRETEAAKLKRMNEEIARIADLLARLTRNESRPSSDVEDRRRGFDPGPPREIAIEPQELRRTIRARRMRDQFFGDGLFEDPAWDMLLDLFAAELEGARVSVSSLCIAAAVAPTTALRWISKMTDAGLFVRQPDPSDRRRAFMALTPRAGDAMRRYIVAVRRADLAIA